MSIYIGYYHLFGVYAGVKITQNDLDWDSGTFI